MSFTIDRRAVTKAVLLITTLSLAVPASAAERRIGGSVTYRERMALPPQAALAVRLLDVSAADSAPALVAETKVVPAGQVPIAFEIVFDDTLIDLERDYALDARIGLSDSVMFATPQPVALAAAAFSQPVELMVTRQSGEGGSLPAEIVGAEWQVEAIAGAELVAGTVSTLVLNERGTAGGNGGCNRFFAAVTSSGSQITFSEFGATEMACAEAVMAQEQAYFAALQRVASFRLEDGRLMLLDAQGEPAVTLRLIA